MVEIELFDETFYSEIEEQDKSIVLFWGEHCSKCHTLFEKIDSEYSELQIEVYTAKIEENPNVIDKLNIYSLPTFIMFANGREVERSEGIISDEILKRFLICG